MKSASWILAGSVCVVLVVAAYAIGRNSAGERDRNLIEREARIERSEVRLQAQERLLPRLPALSAQPGVWAGAPLAAHSNFQAVSAESEILSEQDYYERLYKSDKESTDSFALQGRVAQRIAASSGAESARSQPVERAVECRSGICLISASFAGDGDEWVTRLMMEMHAEFSAVRVARNRNPDGTSDYSIYAFKPGTESLLQDRATGIKH